MPRGVKALQLKHAQRVITKLELFQFDGALFCLRCFVETFLAEVEDKYQGDVRGRLLLPQHHGSHRGVQGLCYWVSTIPPNSTAIGTKPLTSNVHRYPRVNLLPFAVPCRFNKDAKLAIDS